MNLVEMDAEKCQHDGIRAGSLLGRIFQCRGHLLATPAERLGASGKSCQLWCHDGGISQIRLSSAACAK